MFTPRPELWPHLKKREPEQAAQNQRPTARTTPLFVEELREVLGSTGLRAPARSRRREMRLLFC